MDLSQLRGHTLKSLTIDHQANGSDYVYWVVAENAEVEDGSFSVSDYGEVLEEKTPRQPWMGMDRGGRPGIAMCVVR